jgi:hypothetical protein
MSDPQLQFSIGRAQLRLSKPETGHRRSVLSLEIVSVGLVAGIGRHTIWLQSAMRACLY